MERYLYLQTERKEGKDITRTRGEVWGARAGQSHYEKFHFRVPKPFYPLGLHPQRGRGPCAPSKARAIPEPTQGGSRWHPVCPRQLSGNSQQYSASTLEPEGSSAPSGAGQPLSQQNGVVEGPDPVCPFRLPPQF